MPVDVLGVEVAPAADEAAPPAGARVRGQPDEGLPCAPQIPRDHVDGIGAARRYPSHPGEEEARLQQDLDEGGGVGAAHAAALEDEGDVVDPAGDRGGGVTGLSVGNRAGV